MDFSIKTFIQKTIIKQIEDMCAEIENIVILGCLLLSLGSTIGIFINRNKLKNKDEAKGIGLRVIQFTILTVILPLLVILTIKKILPVSTIAVITGTMIGYAFSDKQNEK